MGMTDSQFKAFVRFMIRDVKEAKEETDAEKRNKILDDILKDLQNTLED